MSSLSEPSFVFYSPNEAGDSLSIQDRTSRKPLALLAECDASLVLYCAALFVWLFSAVLLTSNVGFGRVFRAAEYASLAVCVLSELLAGKSGHMSVLSAIILIAFAPLLCFHNGMSILALCVFAFCGRRHDFIVLMKVSFSAVLLAFLLVVLGGLAGKIPSTVSTESRSRTSLGFGWVTFASHYYLNLVTMYVLFRREKLRVVECILILAGDYFIFSLTDARNSFYLVIAFVLFALLLRRGFPIGCLGRCLFSCQFLLCSLFSALLVLCVNPYTIEGQMLDNLVSGRIRLTQTALDTYGITFFGQPVTWITGTGIRSGLYDWSQYLYVDNSYFNVLINQGILVFVIALAFLTIMSYRVARGGILSYA